MKTLLNFLICQGTFTKTEITSKNQFTTSQKHRGISESTHC
jgi:hypothetical protein